MLPVTPVTTFVVMSRQVRLWYYAHATIPTDDAYSLFLQHIRGYTAVTTVALFVQTSSTPSTVLTYTCMHHGGKHNTAVDRPV